MAAAANVTRPVDIVETLRLLGATSQEAAVRRDQLPPESAAFLPDLIAARAVRETRQGRLYASDARPAPVLRAGSVEVRLDRRGLIKLFCFWLLVLLIPVIVIQLSR